MSELYDPDAEYRIVRKSPDDNNMVIKYIIEKKCYLFFKHWPYWKYIDWKNNLQDAEIRLEAQLAIAREDRTHKQNKEQVVAVRNPNSSTTERVHSSEELAQIDRVVAQVIAEDTSTIQTLRTEFINSMCIGCPYQKASTIEENFFFCSHPKGGTEECFSGIPYLDRMQMINDLSGTCDNKELATKEHLQVTRKIRISHNE